MSCTVFKELLIKYYFGDDDDKPKATEYIKMQSHIRSCPECSVNSDKYKGIQAALSGLIKLKTSNNFYNNFLERLPKPSPVNTFLKKIHRKTSKIPRFAWLGSFALIFVIACVFIIKSFSYSQDVPVVYYYGDVEIKRGADTSGWTKLKDYIKIKPGDKIKTDESSSIIFLLSDDTSIRVTENTELKVLSMERSSRKAYSCKIYLIDGTIWISQKDPSNFSNEKLQISTDNAFVDALGADFDVSFIDNNRTSVRIFKGKANFYHIHFSEEKTTLKANESSVCSADQPPTSPSILDLKKVGGWENWNLKVTLNDYKLDMAPLKDVTLPTSWNPANLSVNLQPTGVPSPTPVSPGFPVN